MTNRSTDPILRLLYRAASGNRLSRTAGLVSEVPFPGPVMANLIRTYCAVYKVRLDEAVVPPGGFRTFNEFFTRRLKPGVRTVDPDPGVISSPSDGRIMSSGKVTRGLALQAKGRPYPLARLLGDESLCARYEGGRHLTVYLSPRDYHRVHFPCDGEVTRCHHLPGRLYSVAPRAVDLVDELLCCNERMNTVMDTAFGTLSAVMVGACGVGRISLSYGDMVSNVGRCTGTTRFDPSIPVRKGDDLGAFNLGSTVVMLVEPGDWDVLCPPVGDPVKMGQPLFRLS